MIIIGAKYPIILPSSLLTKISVNKIDAILDISALDNVTNKID